MQFLEILKILLIYIANYKYNILASLIITQINISEYYFKIYY